MSYCRWIEGDVYVYGDVDGTYTCCACPLNDIDNADDFKCVAASEMIMHLHAHRAAGHHVPERAFDELQVDRERETTQAERFKARMRGES